MVDLPSNCRKVCFSIDAADLPSELETVSALSCADKIAFHFSMFSWKSGSLEFTAVGIWGNEDGPVL